MQHMHKGAVFTLHTRYSKEPPLGNERGVGWIGSYTGGGHTAMGCPALPLGRGRLFAKIGVVVFFDAGFGRFGLVFGRGLRRR